MKYINPDQNSEPRTRKIKGKGKGRGGHGGDGLLAWMSFVDNGVSGTSGFPARVKGLRYTISATVTAKGCDMFDVSLDITGAGTMHYAQENLTSALAKDMLGDFNRRWRHTIDPIDEDVQEIEYVEERPKRKLDYNWIPPTSSSGWNATQKPAKTPASTYMVPARASSHKPEEEYEDECYEDECYEDECDEDECYEDECGEEYAEFTFTPRCITCQQSSTPTATSNQQCATTINGTTNDSYALVCIIIAIIIFIIFF